MSLPKGSGGAGLQSSSSRRASLAQQRIAIVGADEYLGQLLVKEYLKRGAQVVAFIPEKAEWTTLMELTDMGATVHAGSLDVIAQNLQDVDAVVCCLGVRYSALIADTNTNWDDHRVALQRVFDIVSQERIRRLIVVSTIEGPFTQRWLPLSKAKENAIQEMKKRMHLNGIKFTVVRPGLLFRDVTSILPGLGNALRGKILNTKRGRKATQTNPIHELDLSHFIVECTNDDRYYNHEVEIGGPEVIYTQELYCKILAARDPDLHLTEFVRSKRVRVPQHLNRWLKYIFNEDMVGQRYGQKSLHDTLRTMEIRELANKDIPFLSLCSNYQPAYQETGMYRSKQSKMVTDSAEIQALTSKQEVQNVSPSDHVQEFQNENQGSLKMSKDDNLEQPSYSQSSEVQETQQQAIENVNTQFQAAWTGQDYIGTNNDKNIAEQYDGETENCVMDDSNQPNNLNRQDVSQDTEHTAQSQSDIVTDATQQEMRIENQQAPVLNVDPLAQQVVENISMKEDLPRDSTLRTQSTDVGYQASQITHSHTNQTSDTKTTTESQEQGEYSIDNYQEELEQDSANQLVDVGDQQIVQTCQQKPLENPQKQSDKNFVMSIESSQNVQKLQKKFEEFSNVQGQEIREGQTEE
eukprot:TRINITY_DN1016_c0_g1_i13.p1 TRINITY_DN1016_c0_g1~~TRINITY_DN1016_c0_g1_i13.p1  ORF type:complete len:635 (-),score=50.29 TRINITY_DN1016_c0_g1_i13:475-2379(-)